jgi:hypothetical protein
MEFAAGHSLTSRTANGQIAEPASQCQRSAAGIGGKSELVEAGSSPTGFYFNDSFQKFYSEVRAGKLSRYQLDAEPQLSERNRFEKGGFGKDIAKYFG